jgi:hypothetical protein
VAARVRCPAPEGGVKVDIHRIIADLKAERDVLAAAIEYLERLAAGRGKKRGRPPAWMKRQDLAAWLKKWSGRYPKLCDWVENNIDGTLTFYRLPRQQHKNLRLMMSPPLCCRSSGFQTYAP